MLAVQGRGNNNAAAVVEPIEIPWSVKFLECFISPLKHAVQWVWDVVVLRAQKDGLALTLLFLGALGIFPAWVGLAIAVTGVVMIAIGVSKVEVELAQVKERRMKLLEDKGTLEKQIRMLEGRASDSQIDHKALGDKKRELEKEIERLQQERSEMISNEADMRSDRDRLQEENEQLLEEKEKWTREKREMEERKKEKEIECTQIREEQEIFRGKNVREGLHQRFQQLCQQVTKGQVVSEDLQKLGVAIQERQLKYREMLQKILDETPEDAPLRVALQGILEFSEEMEEIEKMRMFLGSGSFL